MHDLAASAHEREKRSPAVTVVANRRSLPLGHHGRAADTGRKSPALYAEAPLHVLDEKRTRTHRKGSHQGLRMKAGRAPHVHARLACNGLGGVNGLGLKSRRCKGAGTGALRASMPPSVWKLLTAIVHWRAFGIPGTDLRDGRVRHLQRTHAVALG